VQIHILFGIFWAREGHLCLNQFKSLLKIFELIWICCCLSRVGPKPPAHARWPWPTLYWTTPHRRVHASRAHATPSDRPLPPPCPRRYWRRTPITPTAPSHLSGPLPHSCASEPPDPHFPLFSSPLLRKTLLSALHSPSRTRLFAPRRTPPEPHINSSLQFVHSVAPERCCPWQNSSKPLRRCDVPPLSN
jgi:hypothetical protein